MTKDEALRLALEVLADLGMKHYENTGEVLYKNTYTAIKAALEAKDELVCVCGAVWEGQELVIVPKEEAKDEIDWRDMYEKQKRHTEMWVAKYEKDIGPLEKAVPHQEAKDEPVAWYRDEDGIRIYYESKVWDDATPLYTTPPRRTLVWLTDEEIQTIAFDSADRESAIIKAEAKLKEKNSL